MYKFTDTLPVTEFDLDVPAESILINNIPLERQVSGFTTLNVTGREAIAKKVTSQETANSDGVIFIESKYPSRDITVKYQLSAPTNEEFRQKFELINYYLRNDQFVFGFNDDREYFYVGTLSGVETFPEGTNTGVSTFTITCADPFKYKRKPSIYTGNSITINEPILYPTLPDEIALTSTGAYTSINVSAGTKKLTFNGDFKANDIITIRPAADDQILLNGVANSSIMDFLSPLEDFKLKQDDVVKAMTGVSMSLKIRDKRL